MLYFKEGSFESPNRALGWHVGGGKINPKAAVVSFQADGHELEMIIKAMKLAVVDNSSEVIFPVSALR